MTEGSKETRMANEAAMTEENPEMETQANAADAGRDDPAAALEAENADLKDRLLRAAAEMENLRKRTQREVGDARSYAIANFARDMLAVADNLSRAIEALPEHARRSEEAGFIALIEGVEMTARDMAGALERHGVRKINPEGERFDPNYHQAMFEVPNPEVPSQTVVQVVQTGYVIGERVLRPAMVGVASGGPKAAPKAAEPGPVNPQAEGDA